MSIAMMHASIALLPSVLALLIGLLKLEESALTPTIIKVIPRLFTLCMSDRVYAGLAERRCCD